MTEKYILIDGGVKDTVNGITWDSFLELVIVLNGQSRHLQRLTEENEQMKDIIDTLFNTITELDWAKKEYCNALIRIIGEENDVDKAKQRIKEFME